MSCTISVITSVYEGNRYLPALCGMMARNAGTLGERASLEYIIVNDSPWEKVVLPESDGSFSLTAGTDAYRKAVIEAISGMNNVEGITGSYSFDAKNNPIKTAAIIELTGGDEVFKEMY